MSGGTADVRTPSEGRGQLILVGAVAIAVVFVALSLLFNTAIYTNSLATQQSAGDGSEPLAYQDTAVKGVGGIVYYVNYYNHTGYGELASTARTQIRDWSRNATRHGVASRTATVTRFMNVTNGTQILQNRNRTFEDANGKKNWTFATGVTRTRRFSMQVETGKLEDEGLIERVRNEDVNIFSVQVSNGNRTRYIYLYNNSNASQEEVVVQIENESGRIGRCTAQQNSIIVDITQGTVGGDSCPQLAFPGLEPPYSITYNYSDKVQGRYSLVVDQTVSKIPSGPYNSLASENPPYAVPAIYSAKIKVTYESANLRYTSNRTVAPETPPQGPAFDVSLGPVPREIVYATPGDAWLHSIAPNGTVTNYSVSGVQAIGPKDSELDFDADGYVDVPYVNSSSQLKVIDKNDAAPRHLATSAATSKTLLSVGTWQGETRVFYVNTTDSSIYRASPDGSTQVLAKDGDGDGISAVAGIAKYNDDEDTDLVFTDGSQMVTYVDGGTTHETGVGVGQNNGISIGEPRDAYQNGTRYAPMVDGSNEAELLEYTGSRTFIGGSASKTPVALADWTGDSRLELFYVDGSGNLYYFTLDGTAYQVTDSSGNPVGINTGTGVA